MKKLYARNFLLWLFLACFIFSCGDDDGILLFSIEDDKALGEQLRDEINNSPEEYPVLNPDEYPEAYAYLLAMRDEVLASEDIRYREEFDWETYIIEDDEVLNAFAAPGGYMYFYTGLIKYLDNADDLAGVMGHEIAHADRRHTSRQLQRTYGIQVLLSVVLGTNSGALAEIAAGLGGQLASLQFSRSAEREADDYSVIYLAQTEYQCNGAFSFFQKLIEEQQQSGNTPAFLSTHPNPEDRVEDINAKAAELGCDTTPLAPASYQDFKNALP